MGGGENGWQDHRNLTIFWPLGEWSFGQPQVT